MKEGAGVCGGEYIRDCFNKFRTYLKRFMGRRVQYITVLELQKSGMAHLHVLLGCYIPKEIIDQTWTAVGGGFTWIKYVDVHRVSAYMSKYLTKDLFGAVPSKKKRISTSRGICLFSKRESMGWTRESRSIDYFYRKYLFGKRALVADRIEDDSGLKSFSVVRPPSVRLACSRISRASSRIPMPR